MTGKLLTNLFWETLVWGHIEKYHNNAPEEVLFQRLEDDVSIAASTFITEGQGREGEIADFVLAVLMERLDQINAFLSMRYSCRCLSDLSVIAWNVEIPGGISGKVLKKKDDYISKYVSHKARIVLKRNWHGDIVLLTAYPI